MPKQRIRASLPAPRSHRPRTLRARGPGKRAAMATSQWKHASQQRRGAARALAPKRTQRRAADSGQQRSHSHEEHGYVTPHLVAAGQRYHCSSDRSARSGNQTRSSVTPSFRLHSARLGIYLRRIGARERCIRVARGCGAPTYVGGACAATRIATHAGARMSSLTRAAPAHWTCAAPRTNLPPVSTPEDQKAIGESVDRRLLRRGAQQTPRGRDGPCLPADTGTCAQSASIVKLRANCSLPQIWGTRRSAWPREIARGGQFLALESGWASA